MSLYDLNDLNDLVLPEPLKGYPSSEGYYVVLEMLPYGGWDAWVALNGELINPLALPKSMTRHNVEELLEDWERRYGHRLELT
jgi:hypothetical protein